MLPKMSRGGASRQHCHSTCSAAGMLLVSVMTWPALRSCLGSHPRFQVSGSDLPSTFAAEGNLHILVEHCAERVGREAVRPLRGFSFRLRDFAPDRLADNPQTLHSLNSLQAPHPAATAPPAPRYRTCSMMSVPWNTVNRFPHSVEKASRRARSRAQPPGTVADRFRFGPGRSPCPGSKTTFLPTAYR